MNRMFVAGLIGCGLLAGGMGTTGSRVVLAQEKAGEAAAAVPAAPANPNAALAAQERATGRELMKEANAATAKAAGYTGDLKAAAEALAAADIKKAETHEALAKAWEASDSAQIQKIGQAGIREVSSARDRAWRKLEALEQAAENAKPLNERVIADTPAGAKPELEKLEAAHKNLAKAWEKYAAALAPDAPQNAAEDAYDEVLAASDEVQLAGVALDLARRSVYREGVRAQFKDAELDKSSDAWKKQVDELMVAKRDLAALQARIRKLERGLGRADAENAAVVQKLVTKPAPKPDATTPEPEPKPQE